MDGFSRLQKLQERVSISPERVLQDNLERISSFRASSPSSSFRASSHESPQSFRALSARSASFESPQNFRAVSSPFQPPLSPLEDGQQQQQMPSQRSLQNSSRAGSFSGLSPEQQQQMMQMMQHQAMANAPLDPRALEAIQALKSQIAEGVNQREELQKQRDELQKQRDELQRKLIESTAAAQQEVDMITKSRQKDLEELSALQKEKTLKSKELKQLTRGKEATDKELADAKKEADKLRTSLMDLSQEKSKLSNQLETLKNENTALNETVARVRAQIASSRPSSASASRSSSSLDITVISRDKDNQERQKEKEKEKQELEQPKKSARSSRPSSASRKRYEVPKEKETMQAPGVAFEHDIPTLEASKTPSAAGNNGDDEDEKLRSETAVAVAQVGVQKAIAIPRVRRLLINMFMHVAFVILIIFSVQSTREFKYGYTISSSIRSLYLDNNWSSISTQYDVWNWLSNTFIQQTYAFLSTDYNTNMALPLYPPPNPLAVNLNDNSPQPRPGVDYSSPSDEGYILSNMYLMGGIRVRQVRMDAGDCSVKNIPKFTDASRKSSCAQAYSYFSESTKAFGGVNGTAFAYDSSLSGSPFFGKFGTYSAAGYQVMLSGNDSSAATAAVGRMMTNNYLDRFSSSMFVEMLLFQPSTQLFSIVRFVFEFPVTGGVSTYPSLYIINLNKYGSGDSIVILVEALVLLYIIKMGVDLVSNIRRMRGLFFRKFFNLLDLANFVLYVIVIAIRLRTVFMVSSLSINPSALEYYNLSTTALLVETETNCYGFNGILSFIKLFDFLGIFPRLSMLSATLKQASTDIASFLLIFLIIVLGFAQAFFAVFGKYLVDYADMSSSLSTLFQIILGNFNYSSLTNTNRLLGPLLFVSFVALSFFVLSNMFIALLTDSFVVVKEQIRKKSKQRSVADDLKDFLDEQLKTIASKFGPRKSKVQVVQEELNGADELDAKTFASLKAKLGEEIAKYDLNNDGILDKMEIDMMMKTLSKEEQEIVKKQGLVEKQLEERRNGIDQFDVRAEQEEKKRKREEERKAMMAKMDALSSSVPSIMQQLQAFEDRMTMALALGPAAKK